MERQLTLSELETRWKNTLQATRLSTMRHPCDYRALKSLATDVVNTPVDIDSYFSTVEKLLNHLQRLDPAGRGSLFDIFSQRIRPENIWQVRLLRMECRDLLAHIDAFEQWRRKQHRLRRVK